MHSRCNKLWVQWGWVVALALGGILAAQPAPPQPRARGTVFILSAPSGTGKSTLIRQLVRRVPDLVFAVSHTTRAPRPGEVDGVDYFFVDGAKFNAMLAQGRFAEWVEVYGHRYGLSREWLERQLDSGKDILMDLDTTGAQTVRAAIPEAESVFLLPPSAEELARRLRGRGSETEAQIALRLGQAKRELARFPEFTYLVVATTVERSFQELEAIVLASRARQQRRQPLARKIMEGF